jgi:hypothetical protein
MFRASAEVLQGHAAAEASWPPAELSNVRTTVLSGRWSRELLVRTRAAGHRPGAGRRR